MLAAGTENRLINNKIFLMRYILLIAVIVVSLTATAQISKVSLQASGLTCSMCSNSINKALRSVDFVDKIEANIKTSTFDITFKPGKQVDFDKLKSKVEDAGFFVSKFFAVVHFDAVAVKSDQPVTIGDKTFQFVNVKEQVLNGEQQVKIIDKGFVSAKEYKKSGITSSGSNSGKVYHVTI